MRKTLLLALCLFGLVTINAQETTFFYDFNDNEFTGWQGYDADGDGYNWELHATSTSGGMDGTYGVYSSCYMSGELTPENYLFTTESYLITETSQLHFFHCQSDMVYFEENFGVIVSEDGINFLVIWSKRYKEPYPDGQWGEEFVDLSEFAGKNMYIGFLHYECSGATANGIRIDNVELTSTSSIAENAVSFNIYPNPVENQLVISSEENIETISIYNLNGVMVYSGEYNAEGVDVMNLNAGVYFVNIKTESYDVIRRIVKK